MNKAEEFLKQENILVEGEWICQDFDKNVRTVNIIELLTKFSQYKADLTDEENQDYPTAMDVLLNSCEANCRILTSEVERLKEEVEKLQKEKEENQALRKTAKDYKKSKYRQYKTIIKSLESQLSSEKYKAVKFLVFVREECVMDGAPKILYRNTGTRMTDKNFTIQKSSKNFITTVNK